MEGNVFVELLSKANAKILDYLLDQEVDVSLNDVCEGAEISRKTADVSISKLVEKDIVNITRTIGNAKMYKINSANIIAKKFIELNEEILKQQEVLLEKEIIA